MTKTEETAFTNDAKRLADWLEVDFTISIFGHPIISWHFPPKKR